MDCGYIVRLTWLFHSILKLLFISSCFRNCTLFSYFSNLNAALWGGRVLLLYPCWEPVSWHSLFILVPFSFLPTVHILLVGQAVSALYCWNSELNRFSFILEAPSAYDAAFVTVKSLNSSKNLIALAGATHSHIYELTYVSSQSDFIPR